MLRMCTHKVRIQCLRMTSKLTTVCMSANITTLPMHVGGPFTGFSPLNPALTFALF
jgi:hypothetical protein